MSLFSILWKNKRQAYWSSVGGQYLKKWLSGHNELFYIHFINFAKFGHGYCHYNYLVIVIEFLFSFYFKWNTTRFLDFKSHFWIPLTTIHWQISCTTFICLIQRNVYLFYMKISKQRVSRTTHLHDYCKIRQRRLEIVFPSSHTFSNNYNQTSNLQILVDQFIQTEVPLLKLSLNRPEDTKVIERTL